MHNKVSSILFLSLIFFVLYSCGSYKTMTGTINYDAKKKNEIIKSNELTAYLESKERIKFVLRTPEGFANYSDEQQIRLNGIFGQIEKELIKNGHIVKDRVLLDLLLDKGDMSLTQVGKAINTDIIIEVIDIDFNIPNKIKNFRIKENGYNTNFDEWHNLDYVDCSLAAMECRITLVSVGNVGGIFKFYVSGCDNGADFYINLYEEWSGKFNQDKESYVGWNYGNVNYKSLTHTYDMNDASRKKAIERLVKVLLSQLTSS